MHQSTNWPMDQWANGPMPKQLWDLQLNMKEKRDWEWSRVSYLHHKQKTWECLWSSSSNLVLIKAARQEDMAQSRTNSTGLTSWLSHQLTHSNLYRTKKNTKPILWWRTPQKHSKTTFLLVVTFALLWHGLSQVCAQFSECPVWCIWKYSWTLTF